MNMHLHDFLGWPGPMTHRQYLTLCEWYRMQHEQQSGVRRVSQADSPVPLWTKENMAAFRRDSQYDLVKKATQKRDN